MMETLIDAQMAKRMDLLDAYYQTFTSEAGQKVLDDLKEQCCMNAPTTYGDHMIFCEGKRCIGNYICSQVEQYEKEILNGNNG